jgi:hypothetical protein
MKSFYLVICNLTHLQEGYRGKYYIKNARKNTCGIRNHLKSRIRKNHSESTTLYRSRLADQGHVNS